MTLFLLFLGLLVLVVGAELLVRGASQLATVFKISPLVIGLTIVAFGTSSPEMVVSVKAALTNHPDLVMGTNIGSTIFNVLFILGVCALVAPLVVSQRLVWFEVPIMIVAHLLLLAISADGKINRWDALLLLAGIIGYTLFVIRKGRQEKAAVNSEYRAAFSTKEPKRSPLTVINQLGFIAAGLGLCVLGAGWLLEGAVMLARTLGVSELVIGMTIVAAGTSFPEVATSIVATIRGQRDIAIGNVVGSNIFNILGIIGVAGFIAPNGITVAPSVLRLDLPMAIATCFACLPIFFTGHKISRWEGALFLGYYSIYTSYLLLVAREHDALPMFSMVMLWFVIPLTVVTFMVVIYRSLR
jgi:cation:H+ antiporter